MRKKICVFLCILICAIVSTGTLSSFDGSVTVEAAAKAELSKKTVYVTKGSSTTLSLKGMSGKVKWTSSNKSIATVNAKGKVTGVKKGTATVTAKVGKKTYKCKIVVETPGISKKSISVTVGKTASLKMDGTRQKVTWSSSNKKIAVVSDKGIVKGIKKGTAVITAKAGGKTYKCTVKVASKKVSVTGVVLSKKSLSLKVGQKETLKATVKPTNATNKKVTWKTSNSKVVKVSGGKLTAVGKGTATITAATEGKTAKCTVKVTLDQNKPGTQKPGGDYSSQTEHEYVKKVVSLVNEERAKEGLRPLTLKKDITAVAQLRAVETESLFSHTRPDGSPFFSAMNEAGISYRGVGENIAYGYPTPEQVMTGWMNSPGHRANILNENYTSIGVGYHQAASGGSYWAQIFTY